MALAGYGNRKPKTFDEVLDSVFVRTIVLKTPTKKFAIMSADLLIVHPSMTQAFHRRLSGTSWQPEDVFLTATHTHSSIGQWAPGLVGRLFAGPHQEQVADIIAGRMMEGLLSAEEKLVKASFGTSENENPDLVLNRLMGAEGREDPFQKNLFFDTGKGMVRMSAFSAHATCFTSKSRNLTGDFPSYFHAHLDADTSTLFSLYAAGPVASMGPEVPQDTAHRAGYVGRQLAERMEMPEYFSDSLQVLSFRVPLELGKPQFKISESLVLRPYLFRFAFGGEPASISGLLMNNTLLVGTPCDFSGELAPDLYRYASQKGIELIITSFNGGYIGYVTRDKWYDSPKYETRTMNWYGPGNGQYFSSVIRAVVDGVSQQLQ